MDDFFSNPESVSDQAEREEREAADKLKRQQQQEAKDKAAKPLAGSVGDLLQRDFLGGNGLFS